MFGEHSRGVRVAQGAAECSSSLLSALQTSQVLNISTYAQLEHELIVLQQSDIKDLREEAFYCDRAQNSHNAQKSKQTCRLAG